jgi:hypothetical protein
MIVPRNNLGKRTPAGSIEVVEVDSIDRAIEVLIGS